MKFALDEINSFWGSFLESEGIPYNLPNEKNFKLNESIDNDVYIITYPEKYSSIELLRIADKGGILILPNTNFQKLANMKNIKIAVEKLDFSKEDFTVILENDKYDAVTFNKILFGKGCIYGVVNNLDSLWGLDKKAIKKIVIDGKINAYSEEKLCVIEKRNIRQYAKLVLLDIVNFLDIPLIFIWKYPNSAKSVFNIRVDVDPDKNSDEQKALERIINTFKSAEKHIDRTSWMINFYRRMPNYKFLQKYVEQKYDIQSHAYYHCLFPDKKTNQYNILLAHQLLEKLKIKPVGFNAPEYFWYNHTASIIEEMGYIYSNSLGFDHSNYPYRPLVNNRLRNYLEISPSPINYNRFVNALRERNINILAKYYRLLFENTYNKETPLLFYIHPQLEGKYKDLLEIIFNLPNDYNDIYPVQLTKWAEWLHSRRNFIENLKIDMCVEQKNIKLSSKFMNNSTYEFSLAVQYNSKQIDVYPINKQSIQNINLNQNHRSYFYPNKEKISMGDIIYNPHEKMVAKTKIHWKKVIRNYYLLARNYKSTNEILHY